MVTYTNTPSSIYCALRSVRADMRVNRTDDIGRAHTATMLAMAANQALWLVTHRAITAATARRWQAVIDKFVDAI